MWKNHQTDAGMLNIDELYPGRILVQCFCILDPEIIYRYWHKDEPPAKLKAMSNDSSIPIPETSMDPNAG